MSSCNDKPVKCAIRPTNTAGCRKKASCNAGCAIFPTSSCGKTRCGSKGSCNAWGHRRLPGPASPIGHGWPLGHCRTRSTSGRAPKIIAVVGFAERRARLTSRFAGPPGMAAGHGGGAARHSAGVWSKECSGISHALSDRTCHGPGAPQVHDRPIAAWREENGVGKERGEQAEEEKEVREMVWAGRKRRGATD